ncbi:2,3-bisphosphoglycerate-independent phosphoglycerate mutase [bacterium]|nr:2,3-bisphosphoglycerate-independent phosphoglycerate mutase [bacterium]
MHQLRSNLRNEKSNKILLIVLDGVGGLPFPKLTELEAARTPNLDKLAKKSETGSHVPVLNGLTPGSGSAHLSLFGYDPLSFDIGRGILEALGLDVEVTPYHLSIRGNFSTVKEEKKKLIVTDRRAGRLSNQENKRIVKILKQKISKIDNVKVDFISGIEHRFVCTLKFSKKLNSNECLVADTDPENEGMEPIYPKNLNKNSLKVSKIINKLTILIRNSLSKEKKANYALLRGYSVYPLIPTFNQLYKMKTASIVTYPMYKGISKLVGMTSLNVPGSSISHQLETLKKGYKKYDFFYFHIKKTDSYGEDGNFKKKTGVIEDFDKILPDIIKLNFDVLAITGDHSTPARMKSHSWHPVPVLINSKNSFYGTSKRFTEKECQKGTLGLFEGKYLMNLLLAHAEMLSKFGA